MGSCYSGDLIAENYIHTDIITCTTEEPQQRYLLRMVSNIVLAGVGGRRGGLNIFNGI